MALTSTVVQCWRALYDSLKVADFGAMSANPDGTQVHFGWPDTDTDLGLENVVVIGALQTSANQDPVTFGPGRRKEQFGMIVFATVDVPGATHVEVLDRLEHIGSAIEQAIRTDTTQRPELNGSAVPGVNWWGVSSFRPWIVGGPNGWRGQLEIVVGVAAHI